MPNALLDIPHRERRIFKRHFLNSVHCELAIAIDLNRLLAARDALAAKFQTAGFRYVRDLQQSQVVFHPAAGAAALPRLQNTSTVSGLSFANDSPLRQLNITTSGLVLSDSAYSGFDDFRTRLHIATQQVRESVSDAPVTKIGLRKINAIRVDEAPDPAQAVAAFNTQLFGLARSAAITPSTFKTSQEILLLERDAAICLVRTGLAATGMPNTYDVQLDFDVQHKGPLAESIDSELSAMNAFLYDIFRWAITDEFITVLES